MICARHFRTKAKGKTLPQIYTMFNCTYKEWNTLLPITNDISEMHAQREQLSVLCFLLQLPPKLGTTTKSSLESLTPKGGFSHLLQAAQDLPNGKLPTPNRNLVESSTLVRSST